MARVDVLLGVGRGRDEGGDGGRSEEGFHFHVSIMIGSERSKSCDTSMSAPMRETVCVELLRLPWICAFRTPRGGFEPASRDAG
jgi:hypothetical protein